MEIDPAGSLKSSQHSQNSVSVNTTRRKRKKRKNKKAKQNGVRKDTSRRKQARSNPTNSTMDELVVDDKLHNITSTERWRANHQVAFWKSKATSLEYENRILHEIIRKNYLKSKQCGSSASSSESSSDSSDESEDNAMEEDGDNFEVSEEFVEFLKANAKYREDARQERERLKAKLKTEETQSERPPEPHRDRSEELKEAYGPYWERILALEMSLESQFVEETDKEKPTYWPLIPLNY